jgi:glycosyltransferase 2 family protein
MPNFLKSKYFKWTISAVLTLGLLFLLSKQISFEKIPEIFSHVSWVWFAAALVIYYVSTLIRAERFRVLGIRGLPLWKLSNISLIHYFLSNLLPFRSGELSFVYLVNKDKAAGFAANVSALVLARIFDFLAVVVWLIASIVMLFPERLKSLDPIVLAAFGLMLFLLAALTLLLFGRRVVGLLSVISCICFTRAFPIWKADFWKNGRNWARPWIF